MILETILPPSGGSPAGLALGDCGAATGGSGHVDRTACRDRPAHARMLFGSTSRPHRGDRAGIVRAFRIACPGAEVTVRCALGEHRASDPTLPAIAGRCSCSAPYAGAHVTASHSARVHLLPWMDVRGCILLRQGAPGGPDTALSAWRSDKAGSSRNAINSSFRTTRQHIHYLRHQRLQFRQPIAHGNHDDYRYGQIVLALLILDAPIDSD